jgi:TRAP-type C4-dicarboxylate transport system permease small subunit
MPEQRKVIGAIQAFAYRLGRVGNIGGSIMIALMTGLITVDVLGRYLFGAPTYIATEVSAYLMAAMVFLGLAWVSRVGHQIEVTVIIDRLPKAAIMWIKFATLSASLFFVAWFTLLTVRPVVQNLQFKTISITPLKTPMWIPTIFVPLGLSLLAVELLAQWLPQIVNIFSIGHPSAEMPKDPKK